MRVYGFKAYGSNWELIAQTTFYAEDLQAAELQEEMLADDLRDIGHTVKGTSVKRIR